MKNLFKYISIITGALFIGIILAPYISPFKVDTNVLALITVTFIYSLLKMNQLKVKELQEEIVILKDKLKEKENH